MWCEILSAERKWEREERWREIKRSRLVTERWRDGRGVLFHSKNAIKLMENESGIPPSGHFAVGVVLTVDHGRHVADHHM